MEEEGAVEVEGEGEVVEVVEVWILDMELPGGEGVDAA